MLLAGTVLPISRLICARYARSVDSEGGVILQILAALISLVIYEKSVKLQLEPLSTYKNRMSFQKVETASAIIIFFEIEWKIGF